MEQNIDYRTLELSDLEKLADAGDARAALKAGFTRYDKCRTYYQKYHDKPEEAEQYAVATDEFRAAEARLLFAYEHAENLLAKSRAADVLEDLYSLEIPVSPLFSEETARTWRQRGVEARMRDSFEKALALVYERTATLRSYVYEYAEQKSADDFHKIGESLLSLCDDVVTPNKWKSHGYGTPGDAETVLDQFEDAFNAMLKKFISDAVTGDSRLHDALMLLTPDERRHIEARLVDAEQDDVRDSLRENYFSFESIPRLRPRDIQKMLREVDNIELATALKKASGFVHTACTQNMSRRAAAMLEEEVEFAEPTDAEIYAAQERICAVVRRLAEDGEIALSL